MKSTSLMLIDTTQRQGWIGVSRDGAILSSRTLDPMRGHARDLGISALAALTDANIALPNLTAIAINVGPGSFTGIRVALATAMAIAYTAGTKLIAIDVLDLVARGFAGVTEDFRVVVESQLNGWIVCDFARRVDGTHLRGGTRIVSSGERNVLRTSVPLCGPGVEKLNQQLSGQPTLHAGPWVPNRDAYLALALDRVREGAYADPFTIEPIYAMTSSAEQLWQNRTAASSG